MFVIIGEKSKAASLSSTNLCLSCGNYSHRKNALDDKEVRECGHFSGKASILTGPVSVCSGYYDSTKMTMREMKEMAWIIEASKRKVGFGELLMDIDIVPPDNKKRTSNIWDE